MIDQSYEGFYARFDTPSKKVGSMLMGADTLVGDDLKVEFRNEKGKVVAWLLNKFDAEVGFLEADGSLKLQLANARGQEIRALLSYVAYSDMPDPGHYWGEAAFMCFNPAYADEMNAFANRVGKRMAEGVRPAIALGSSAVSKIFNEPDWMPEETVPFPKKERGMAILKDHQSASEKMIERGRAGNKGCYAVSIAFIVVVVLAVAYGIAKVFGVF